MKTSSYSGFFKLSTEDRMKEVAEFCGLSAEEQAILRDGDSLDMEKADHMIENVIGRFTLPMGVGINFVINGKDYVIPMVTEEPSVVAACSNAAKMARPGGGFTTDYTGSVMISQIQLLDVPAPFYAKGKILAHKETIAEICNAKDPMLVKLGGGVKGVEVRVLDSIVGPMVIVHLLVDTGDAMGANAVNTMAEAVAPYLEELTGGEEVVDKMLAGVHTFDCTIGGIGGQVANFLDGVPVKGIGDYYFQCSRTGLVSTEDFVTMVNGMGVQTGVDEQKTYALCRAMEKILGHSLYSFTSGL